MQKNQDLNEWFNETYMATHPIVERAGRVLLARICPALLSELEDVIQDTYYAMYRKARSLVRHPNITGWLIQAMKYVILKRERTWARHNKATQALKQDAKTAAAAHCFGDFLVDDGDLEIMKTQIGDQNVKLLWSYYIKKTPISELATMYGVSEGAMYTRLSRPRKRCERILSDSGLKTMLILFIELSWKNS